MFLLIIPAFIFYEGRYLIKHPWTFNWTATIVWAIITGMSFLLFRIETAAPFTPFVWGAATLVYYLLKINLNRPRPEVMKRHYQHYRNGTHTHTKHQYKRARVTQRPGPQRKGEKESKHKNANR